MRALAAEEAGVPMWRLPVVLAEGVMAGSLACEGQVAQVGVQCQHEGASWELPSPESLAD